MSRCKLCRFEVEEDDVELHQYGAALFDCICVACWHRETDDAAHRASASVNGNTPVAREVRRLLGSEGKQ